MKILNVAYPLLTVGPGSAGGAEQILYLLDRRYVEASHRSIVIAAEGSRVGGELVPTPAASGEITEGVRISAQRFHLARIEETIARESPDIVHFHGLDFDAYLPRLSAAPLFATIHLPPSWYSSGIFGDPRVHVVFVSRSQANGTALPRVSVIGNGIDLRSYQPGVGAREFLLWMGRICPEKGTHIALSVAHSLDLPMIIAGPVHPFRDHQEYFVRCVEPLLDSERRYVGPVDLPGKMGLLAKARCVLLPSLVAETSSLVAMEAAASGTPVVAFRSGALPEVVLHQVTGFIVDSEEEMARAAVLTSEISPQACRDEAERHFSADRMADEYLTLYESIRV